MVVDVEYKFHLHVDVVACSRATRLNVTKPSYLDLLICFDANASSRECRIQNPGWFDHPGLAVPREDERTSRRRNTGGE